MIHTRSLMKAISYRTMGTVATAVIVYFLSGSSSFAFQVSALELVSKIGLFYLHERIWEHVK